VSQLLELSAKYAEFLLSHNCKNSFEKFLGPDPDPDRLPKFNGYFLVRSICLVKFLMKIRSVVANTQQTNKQTKTSCKNTLFGGGKNQN